MPAHSSHLIQPLDQAFFRSIKVAWSAAAKRHIAETGDAVGLESFAKVFKPVWETTTTKSNAEASFRAAGIFPFSPERVLESKKLEPSRIYHDDSTTAIQNPQPPSSPPTMGKPTSPITENKPTSPPLCLEPFCLENTSEIPESLPILPDLEPFSPENSRESPKNPPAFFSHIHHSSLDNAQESSASLPSLPFTGGESSNPKDLSNIPTTIGLSQERPPLYFPSVVSPIPASTSKCPEHDSLTSLPKFDCDVPIPQFTSSPKPCEKKISAQ